MAAIGYADYRPDVSDLNGKHTQLLRNVVPRGDGYGPFKDISGFTQAVGATCRGGYYARNTVTGEVVIFAGTVNRLYKLNNTTLAWEDVSKGLTAYGDLDADRNWCFTQFGNFVVATQRNDVMQQFDVTSDTEFDDVPDDPPQAGWIFTVGKFAVALDLLDDPSRVAWCGIGDLSNWTFGTGLSDFQDLTDGGRCMAGLEISDNVAIIAQDSAIRRMTFMAGSDVIFEISKLQSDLGILAQHSLTAAGGMALFVSTKGFAAMAADGSISFIGEERVDRAFLGQLEPPASGALLSLAYDSGSPQLVIGAADPKRNLVLWVYKSQAGDAGLFDRGLIYHWTAKRWAPVEAMGEYIVQVSRPGLTLEALDALAPGAQVISGAANNGSGLVRLTVGSTAGWTTGDSKTISAVEGTTEANGTWLITVVDGTHIDLQGSAFVNAYSDGGVVGGSLDDLPFSLDDVSTATLPGLAAFSSENKLGFFAGATLEAVLETPEQRFEGRRMDINAIWPRSDASAIFVSVASRDTLNGQSSYGDESAMDADGQCPVLAEGRNVRCRSRIPAGTAWNYATGLEIEAQPAGAF